MTGLSVDACSGADSRGRSRVLSDREVSRINVDTALFRCGRMAASLLAVEA